MMELVFSTSSPKAVKLADSTTFWFSSVTWRVFASPS